MTKKWKYLDSFVTDPCWNYFLAGRYISKNAYCTMWREGSFPATVRGTCSVLQCGSQGVNCPDPVTRISYPVHCVRFDSHFSRQLYCSFQSRETVNMCCPQFCLCPQIQRIAVRLGALKGNSVKLWFVWPHWLPAKENLSWENSLANGVGRIWDKVRKGGLLASCMGDWFGLRSGWGSWLVRAFWFVKLFSV